MKPEAGKRQGKLSEAGTHGDQKTSPVITVNTLRTAESLSAARGARITSLTLLDRKEGPFHVSSIFSSAEMILGFFVVVVDSPLCFGGWLFAGGGVTQ